MVSVTAQGEKCRGERVINSSSEPGGVSVGLEETESQKL